MGNSSPLAVVTDDGTTATLTPEQWTVIEWMTEGETITAAAAAAGVSRWTVHRWRTADPAFRAAVAAWQAEVAESARNRLAAMADAAVSVLHAAVEKGDKAAALAVLKAQGAMTPGRPRRPGE